VASWARYAEGTDEAGQPHEVNDARAPQLQAAARRQHDHPAAFLEDNRAIFGDLADDTRFTGVYTAILASLQERGVRATLAGLDRYAAA
jgi:mannitol 2-dehydrogenase